MHTVTFSVVTDADNDGVPKTVEDSCLGGGDDDPTNADDDRDNDGLPNVNDPQPCVAASSYTAIVEINPDPLPAGSSGSPVTAYVRVPGQRRPDSGFERAHHANRGSGRVDEQRLPERRVDDLRRCGTAKFDRQKLIQHLASRNIHNSLVSITVSRRSGAPVWAFEGSDDLRQG